MPQAGFEGAAAAGDALTRGDYEFDPLLLALSAADETGATELIREIAGQIQARQIGEGRQGLAVCGPSLGVGVSLICTSLAITLALGGASVLLIDGNLHEPALDRLIAPPAATPGFADLLADEALTLHDVAHREVIPGLAILYAGGPRADASELLGGTRCGYMLRECQREFDFTLVDTPPANRSVDARRIAGIMGYALIVARRNVTYAEDVTTLAKELAFDGATVVGSVLNRF